MAYCERQALTLTVAADGTATGYFAKATGKINAIAYVKPGSNNFVNGVDFTITAESTGQTIWTEANVNASKVCAPRLATHGTDGVAALYASGGTAVQDKIAIAEDRVKVVIAQGSGGSGGETGTFILILE